MQTPRIERRLFSSARLSPSPRLDLQFMGPPLRSTPKDRYKKKRRRSRSSPSSVGSSPSRLQEQQDLSAVPEKAVEVHAVQLTQHLAQDPPNLFRLTGARNPHWYEFVELLPKDGVDLTHRENKDARCAYCKRCHQEIPFKTGKSAVKRHLEKHHREYLAECARRQQQEQEVKAAVAENLLHGCEVEGVVTSVTKEQQKNANKYLALWIASSLRPLSLAEDDGLRYYVAYLTESLGRVKVKVPGRAQVRSDIVETAEELRAAIKAKIASGCKYYSVTTDIWTSRSNDGYVSLTLHYLDENFHQCNWTLEVKHLPGVHTGAVIAEALSNLMANWDLNPAYCTKLVRDGASNGVLACSTLGIADMQCIAHSLHLVLAAALIRKPTKIPKQTAAWKAARVEEIRDDTLSPISVSAARQNAVSESSQTAVEETDENHLAEPWEQERALDEVTAFLYEWRALDNMSALDDVQYVVQRFHEIAAYVHKSQKATNRLKIIQRSVFASQGAAARKLRPLKVIIDCPTRWNSTRDMLARMVELQVPMERFFGYLKSKPGKKELGKPQVYQPDVGDYFTIKCFLALLNPIGAISEHLSGQKHPTLALTLPCLRSIESTLMRDDIFDDVAANELSPQCNYVDDTLELMRTVRLRLLALFQKRFKKLPSELSWISYLDPRLTIMEGLTPDEVKNAKSSLITETVALAVDAQAEEMEQARRAENEEPQLDALSEGSIYAKQLRINVISSIYGQRAAQDPHAIAAYRAEALKRRCEAEVYRYLDDTARTPIAVNPLKWWRKNRDGYPYLALLARKWLGCVATSVPSERAFSSAGNTVTAKRSSLSPSLVRDVLFIHENSRYPDPKNHEAKNAEAEGGEAEISAAKEK